MKSIAVVVLMLTGFAFSSMSQTMSEQLYARARAILELLGGSSFGCASTVVSVIDRSLNTPYYH